MIDNALDVFDEVRLEHPGMDMVLYIAEIIDQDATGQLYYKEVGCVIYSGFFPFAGVHFGRVLASSQSYFASSVSD